VSHDVSASPVLVQDLGGVLHIELNRPHVRNAVDLDLARGLRAALDRLDADETLVVGVLSGAGGTFCAGMDLKAFSVTGEVPVLARGGFAGITAAPPRKPLVAAIEGWALAGGLEIALACDLAVAARDAFFGLPEVGVGLVAAAGGLVELPRRVPRTVALRMALTGDPIGAEAAYEAALVAELAEPGGALTAATELARRIARNSPRAVELSKQILRTSTNWPASGWQETQARIIGDLYESPDAREGALAFAERRTPRWQTTAHSPDRSTKEAERCVD
jgi:enoyl-CoA hydratase